jgi:hypothetical protein
LCCTNYALWIYKWAVVYRNHTNDCSCDFEKNAKQIFVYPFCTTRCCHKHSFESHTHTPKKKKAKQALRLKDNRINDTRMPFTGYVSPFLAEIFIVLGRLFGKLQQNITKMNMILCNPDFADRERILVPASWLAHLAHTLRSRCKTLLWDITVTYSATTDFFSRRSNFADHPKYKKRMILIVSTAFILQVICSYLCSSSASKNYNALVYNLRQDVR